MKSAIISIIGLVLMCTITTVPAMAGDLAHDHGPCATAIRLLDKITVEAVVIGRDPDFEVMRGILGLGCVAHSGDIQILATGLMAELDAAIVLKENRSPSSKVKAVVLFIQANQFFTSCSGSRDQEVRATCTILKGVTRLAAENLTSAEEPAPAEPAPEAPEAPKPHGRVRVVIGTVDA